MILILNFFFQPSKFCFVASIFQEMSKLLPIWETCFLVPIDLNISLCVKFSAELGWHHNHNFTITSISTSTRIRCTLKKIQSSILPSYSHLIKLLLSHFSASVCGREEKFWVNMLKNMLVLWINNKSMR